LTLTCPQVSNGKRKPSEWKHDTIIELNEDATQPTAWGPLRPWEGKLKCKNYYKFLCGFTERVSLFRQMAVFWIPPVRFWSKFDNNYRWRGWMSFNGLLTGYLRHWKRKETKRKMEMASKAEKGVLPNIMQNF
jgi:hypothetical protein